MRIVANVARNLAEEIDPHATLLAITEEGKAKADMLRGKGTLGAVLNALEDKSPQSINSISEFTDIAPATIQLCVKKHANLIAKSVPRPQ